MAFSTLAVNGLNKFGLGILLISFVLLVGCSGEQEKKGPVNPPGVVTKQEGLTKINSTRDHTLYADMEAGKVKQWIVQDKEGNSVPIEFKKENKEGQQKCFACIQKEDDKGATESKCWEIPCESMRGD